MEGLDAIAHRYGVRPSGLLGIEDPMEAFAVDRAAYTAGVNREKREAYLAGVKRQRG